MKMKKMFFLIAFILFLLSPIILWGQENKDIISFSEMMIGVKAPMEAKVIIKNESMFAKSLELYPDMRYKKMDLSANWGTVAERTVFLPESNQAVVNFFFSVRRVDLEALIEFQENMEDLDNIVEAGIFDLDIKTSRAKYVTALVRFSLNGEDIVRNINFLLETNASSSDLPLFTAVITDEMLGIPVLTFEVESKLPFDCFIENKKLGLSFAVGAAEERDIVLLAPKVPADGVYKFTVRPEVGGLFIPSMELSFLIKEGKISLKSNPFTVDQVSNGGNGKGNSLCSIKNKRNIPLTILVPAEYVGKNSGVMRKKSNYAVGPSNGMSWTAIQLAPRSTTKVWLAKSFFNSLIVSGQETNVKMFHVENRPSQTIEVGW